MENSCKKCVYYVQHYFKAADRFRALYCGHCKNTRPDGRWRKTDKPCEFYAEKDAAAERAEQLKSVAEYLSAVVERLDGLKDMLATDGVPES